MAIYVSDCSRLVEETSCHVLQLAGKLACARWHMGQNSRKDLEQVLRDDLLFQLHTDVRSPAVP